MLPSARRGAIRFPQGSRPYPWQSDFCGFVNLMRLQRELQVPIGLEAFTALSSALLVGIDDFSDALVTLQLRWKPWRQIDQQVRRGNCSRLQNQGNRRTRVLQLFVQTHLVRNERPLVKSPKQFVERLRFGKRVVDDDDFQILEIGLFRQAACKGPALLCGAAFQDVEVDAFGHAALVRWIKKSTSRGTGRPVLPF